MSKPRNESILLSLASSYLLIARYSAGVPSSTPQFKALVSSWGLPFLLGAVLSLSDQIRIKATRMIDFACHCQVKHSQLAKLRKRPGGVQVPQAARVFHSFVLVISCSLVNSTNSFL